MNRERTITICGQDVTILYCAATETGYEAISGQSCAVFMPVAKKEEHGHTFSSAATTADYLKLGIAAIVASYASHGQQAPLTSEDILYRASAEEVTSLITSVIEMRAEWYAIPSVVPAEDGPSKTGAPKN